MRWETQIRRPSDAIPWQAEGLAQLRALVDILVPRVPTSGMMYVRRHSRLSTLDINCQPETWIAYRHRGPFNMFYIGSYLSV